MRSFFARHRSDKGGVVLISLKSHFKTRIEAMLKHKEALGFSASSYLTFLLGFDEYCQSRFPDEKELTKELVMSWARKREAETINTLNRRLAAIREFARYLLDIGKQAYVYPQKMSPSQTRYVPHIFTDSELSMFFRGTDNFDELPDDGLSQYIVPVVFRVIYCCGLRPSEGRLIQIKDIDLNTGRLYIRESKRHKDRAVVLSDEVLDLCNTYSTILT
jgi:integrase